MKRNPSNRNWNIVSGILLGLLLLIQGWFMWKVWKLNMLPNGYFMALAGGLLLITALLGLLMYRKQGGKWQKNRIYGRQVIGYILSAVVIAGCLVAGYVVGQVQETIHAITAPEKINVVLEVYVRAEDEAQYIQDTAGYSFAVSEDVPEEDIRKILDELEELLGAAVEPVRYSGSANVLDALLNGEVDAAIVNSEYLSVMEEIEGYGDIQARIRMLHELVIEKEVIPETKPVKTGIFGKQDDPTEEDKQEVKDVLSDPFLVYISGNDARRAMLADGGSDVNILLLVNPESHQILMINTPRDYYVINFASGNGSRDKLSHCGLKGIDNCILAMEDLYGEEIDYYARINFSGFRTLVDAIGGVTVYSDVAFKAGDYAIRQGENHLNGAQALSFARERKNLRGGDNDRGKNQMKLIGAMVKQLSVGNLVSNYTDILKSLEGMFTTDLPAEDIGRLVQMQLTEMPDWEILTFAVTGDNGNDICWAAGGYGYVMYPHEHMVEHASQLMECFLNGEVLTEADMTP